MAIVRVLLTVGQSSDHYKRSIRYHIAPWPWLKTHVYVIMYYMYICEFIDGKLKNMYRLANLKHGHSYILKPRGAHIGHNLALFLL